MEILKGLRFEAVNEIWGPVSVIMKTVPRQVLSTVCKSYTNAVKSMLSGWDYLQSQWRCFQRFFVFFLFLGLFLILIDRWISLYQPILSAWCQISFKICCQKGSSAAAAWPRCRLDAWGSCTFAHDTWVSSRDVKFLNLAEYFSQSNTIQQLFQTKLNVTLSNRRNCDLCWNGNFVVDGRSRQTLYVLWVFKFEKK